MFEKEADFAETKMLIECKGDYSKKKDYKKGWQDGVDFGYNKGYHDAEEHYLNVINSQHKLVDESKKKDFRKCMKCTTGTYQSGFKDGYNKANDEDKWHFVKDGDYPKDMENVLINAFDYGINTCYVAHRLNGKWRSNCSSEIFVHVIAWKEIVPPKEIKEK